MSREIKFRAWDSYARKYAYSDPQGITGWHHHRLELIGGKWMISFDRGMGDVVTREPEEVEQFTGLYDKNGVEIYIGDVMLLDLISGDRSSEVKICDVREIPVVRFFDEDGPHDGWEPLHAYVGKPDTCLEVIGHIHEAEEG